MDLRSGIKHLFEVYSQLCETGYGNSLSLASERLILSAFFYMSKVNWDAQQPKDFAKSSPEGH
jgi:hypothetical protein